MRLENLALRWLAEQRYAETTHRTYYETVRQFARRFPIAAERVTADHLIDFLTLDTDGSPTKRAPNTLHRQRVILGRMFRWAVRRGHLRRNPAEHLGELVLGTGRVRAGRWLTREQAQRLVAVLDVDEVEQHRDRVMVLTALLTGLRRTELVRLRWRDVDLDDGRVAVVGKGSKPSVIGLPAEALRELAEWRDRARRESGGHVRSSSPVFPTGRTIGGGICARFYRVDWQHPMTAANFHRIIARCAEQADLGAVGAHDLRRSFAGWLDEDGVDLAGVQAALRHAGPGVTVTCYLDPSPRRAIEAVRGLEIGLQAASGVGTVKRKSSSA